MKRLVDWMLGAVTAVVLVALYAPIVLVVLLSFIPMRRGRVDWGGFTVDPYRRLLQDGDLGGALANSLLVGALAVSLASLFAVGAALLVRASPRSQAMRALEFVIFLPFLLPPIIVGLSLLILFRETGVPRSLGTVVVGHATFLSALVYRIVMARLDVLPASLTEAARDLGATRWQTFRLVVLPNLYAPLLTAALLAFALSFDETMITLFLAGGEPTLPLRLYAMMRSGFGAETNAIATLVLGATVLLAGAAGLSAAWRRSATDAEFAQERHG